MSCLLEYKVLAGGGAGDEEAKQAASRSKRRQLEDFLLHSKGNREPLGHFEQVNAISKLLLRNTALAAESRAGL